MSFNFSKKRIGKIQLYSGIVLLLVTVISSIIIIKEVYNMPDKYYEVIDNIWNQLYGQVEEPITPMISMQISGGTIERGYSVILLTKMGIYLLGAGALILLALSLILILQGLANQSKKR